MTKLSTLRITLDQVDETGTVTRISQSFIPDSQTFNLMKLAVAWSAGMETWHEDVTFQSKVE